MPANPAKRGNFRVRSGTPLALGTLQANFPRLHFHGVIQDTIKQRLRASLLAAASRKTVLDAAAHLAGEITEEGTWLDLDARGEPPAGTPKGSQLERTLFIAKARHLAPGELDDAVRRGLDWWLSRDLRGANARQDQITVPTLVGEIALLFEDDLSLGAAGKVLEILARSRWAEWHYRDGWVERNGGFLLGVAYVGLLRGCLEKSSALCETAFRRAFRNLQWNPASPAFYNADLDDCRASFPPRVQDYARLIALAYGTPWQASTDSVKSFVSYLLDFQQWTTRQGAPRADAPAVVASRESSDARTLADSVLQLAHLGNPPRRSELVALAERLVGHGKPLSGHRYFWRSHFVVHHRPTFYAALRLQTSDRAHLDVTTSHVPLVAGGLYLLRDGSEYSGVTSGLSHRAFPGVTAIQRRTVPTLVDLTRPDPHRRVGGVSEGECGFAALELAEQGLQGKKAWFFFDDAVACLDAGLYGPAVSEPVHTTVNRCRLSGPVAAEHSPRQRRILSSNQTHDLTAVRSVEHGGLRYHFPGSLHVVADLQNDAVNDPATGETNGVLTLWIDHGLKPSGAASAYLITPTDDDPAAEGSHLEILANTAMLQAVLDRRSRTLGVVFWDGGVVPLSGGSRVAANRSCLVLCREDASGTVSLNVSNLTRQPATVHVEHGGRCFAFDLPASDDRGGSVSRQY